MAVIGAVLAGARVALPFVLKRSINRRLAAIPDYTGWVDSISVGLWRGAYALERPVILKKNGTVKEPFFRAEEIDFSIAWRELFRGRWLGDIVLTKPTLTFVVTPTEATSQAAVDHRWQEVITDIFPVDITVLKISDGEVRYINRNESPKVDLRVARLEATATGLRNRADESNEEFPAMITAQGDTIGNGRLTLSAHLEPLAQQPHFLLKLQVERVMLKALNDFLRAYGSIDVNAGTFNGYVEAVARDGNFKGYFKPFFENVDFSAPPGEERPFGRAVWETLVRGFAWVFKNHARDQVATRIPFSGRFENLQIDRWESFKNLAHHAFIEPLVERLDSRAPNTTPTELTPTGRDSPPVDRRKSK